MKERAVLAEWIVVDSGDIRAGGYLRRWHSFGGLEPQEKSRCNRTNSSKSKSWKGSLTLRKRERHILNVPIYSIALTSSSTSHCGINNTRKDMTRVGINLAVHQMKKKNKKARKNEAD